MRKWRNIAFKTQTLYYINIHGLCIIYRLTYIIIKQVSIKSKILQKLYCNKNQYLSKSQIGSSRVWGLLRVWSLLGLWKERRNFQSLRCSCSMITRLFWGKRSFFHLDCIYFSVRQAHSNHEKSIFFSNVAHNRKMIK